MIISIIKLIIQSLMIAYFCYSSAVVFLVGKSKTGIKIDYLTTTIFLLIAMWLL